MDGPEVFQAQGLADQRVDRHLGVTQAQAVLHRGAQAHRHLGQRATSEFTHQCRVSEDLNRMFGTSKDLEVHSCGPM
ncbi:hypothetical protein D3C73_1632440 [compost metagenome]